jgi:DNA-binding CsgD family transcriptional regulator
VKSFKQQTEYAAFASPTGPRADYIREPDREQLYRNVRNALFNSGHGLTPREAEVCASIVLGCTAQGTGRKLNISAHTVATHRKRAYSKLGIGSQNELFARYIDAAYLLRQSVNPGWS